LRLVPITTLATTAPAPDALAWLAVLAEPLQAGFMTTALAGGALAAAMCAIAGTWVVVRGAAFLGEALGHGMLPGVAIATLTGAPPVLGAAASAAVMSVAVSTLSRRARLADDTAIGLVFAGMLALGVVIVSQSRSFAVDLTAILFGDVLALGAGDLALLAAGLSATAVIAVAGHRGFVAATFDERIAATLGLRPRLATAVLTGLVTLAVVVSYQAIGTLLVVALLLAPAAAARPWTGRIATTMALASVLGALAVAVGLLVSWHLATAASASIALAAIAIAALSGALGAARSAFARRRSQPPLQPQEGAA
jgi:zinc/manganese transport system permease protein